MLDEIWDLREVLCGPGVRVFLFLPVFGAFFLSLSPLVGLGGEGRWVDAGWFPLLSV